MKIKITRQFFGSFFSGHVLLHAWSDSEDDYYTRSPEKNFYAIKVDFYPWNRGSITFSEPDSYYEDHNSVIFDSQKKFSDFCMEIINSEFSRDNSFSIMDRNCVHSIKFALETANIDVNFDETRTCKHLVACFCCPSTLTTPRELITVLKEEKNKIPLAANYKVNEETPLIEQVHPVPAYNEEKSEGMKRIRKLEEASIRDEQISMNCYLATLPSVLSEIVTIFGTAHIAASVNVLIPVAAAAGSIACGAGTLYTANFFHNKAKNRSKEIEEQYKETFGEAVRAPSGMRMDK